MNQASLAKPLLTWYDQYGRHDLPWKKNPTPYRVWVSEIMLQQTQVTTVIPYYQKFMKRFPNLKLLALANQDEVLSHWSGLGYYARARNLHRSAQRIYKEYQGRFPNTLEEVTELPGIGRSTAAAILSFSKDIPGTILDGNVKRVLTRYHAVEGWPGLTKVNNTLWSIAEQHTPQNRCQDYNQAIMDLGATICTRRKPKCNHCPLQQNCEAYAQNRQDEFPYSKAKTKKTPIKQTQFILMLDQQGRVLLEKRPPTGIWGSLWSFPECQKENIEQWCLKNYQFKVISLNVWPIISHKFSHFQLNIKPIVLEIKKQKNTVMESQKQVWYNTNSQYPGGIAAPVRRLLDQLKTKSLRETNDT